MGSEGIKPYTKQEAQPESIGQNHSPK